MLDQTPNYSIQNQAKKPLDLKIPSLKTRAGSNSLCSKRSFFWNDAPQSPLVLDGTSSSGPFNTGFWGPDPASWGHFLALGTKPEVTGSRKSEVGFFTFSYHLLIIGSCSFALKASNPRLSEKRFLYFKYNPILCNLLYILIDNNILKHYWHVLGIVHEGNRDKNGVCPKLRTWDI